MQKTFKLGPKGWGHWLLALLLLSFSLHFLVAKASGQHQAAKTDQVHRIQTRLALASAYFEAKMWLFAMEEVDQALSVSPDIPEGFDLSKTEPH